MLNTGRLNAAITWLSRSRRSAFVAAGVFALLTTWFFAPALLGDRQFTVTAAQQGVVYPWAATPAIQPFALQSDQADLSLPALRVQHEALASGSLAFWDPYSYGGGYPLYADFSTGQAYPPRIVLAGLLDPIDAHLWFAMLHVFAAGMFTYLLLRRLGSRWISGVLAGSAWMYGSWTLAWVQLAPIMVTSALLPAGLWAIHRACTRPRWHTIAVAGALLGANVIAGHVLFGIVSAGAVALYGVATTARDAFRRRREDDIDDILRRLAIVPMTALVAAGLWAFSLLPMALVRGTAARASLTYEELTASQLADRELFKSILRGPRLPLSLVDFNGLTFVGTVVGLLAIVGLFTRRPGSGLGRALVVILGLAAVGGPVTWLMFHVPAMDLFRPYNRLALFVGFGVAVLGACGFDALADRVAPFVNGLDRPVLRPILFAVAAAALAVNVVQLRSIGRDVNPGFPPDDAAYAFPETAFSRALRTAEGSTAAPGRAVAISPIGALGDAWSPPILWAAESAWLGLESSSGYNAVLPRRTQRLLRVLTGEDVETVIARDALGAYIPEFHWKTARDDLFARAGYNLVVTPPSLSSGSEWGHLHVDSGELTSLYEGDDGNVYAIVGAAPGPHDAVAVAVVDSDDDALRRFVDPALPPGTLVLTAAEARKLDLHDGDELPGVTTTSVHRELDSYEFTTFADEDTVIVVPINWDEGWEVDVDGRELAVERGNYNQIVVPVPAGSSAVRLEFRPPGLRAGQLITVLTVVVIVCIPGIPWARRRLRVRAARHSGSRFGA